MHKACSNTEKEPYFFHGHTSNFLVTQIEKSQILTQIECFRTVTWVWIHRYLWNNAQSLKWDRRDALFTGGPLHSRALAHSRAPLFTQPCPHCSHSRAPGEQWARLCVFTLQGCVQAARLCRGSPVLLLFKVIRQISRSQGLKNNDLTPIWAFLDDNYNLNSLMSMKWHT